MAKAISKKFLIRRYGKPGMHMRTAKQLNRYEQGMPEHHRRAWENLVHTGKTTDPKPQVKSNPNKKTSASTGEQKGAWLQGAITKHNRGVRKKQVTGARRASLEQSGRAAYAEERQFPTHGAIPPKNYGDYKKRFGGKGKHGQPRNRSEAAKKGWATRKRGGGKVGFGKSMLRQGRR